MMNALTILVVSGFIVVLQKWKKVVRESISPLDSESDKRQKEIKGFLIDIFSLGFIFFISVIVFLQFLQWLIVDFELWRTNSNDKNSPEPSSDNRKAKRSNNRTNYEIDKKNNRNCAGASFNRSGSWTLCKSWNLSCLNSRFSTEGDYQCIRWCVGNFARNRCFYSLYAEISTFRYLFPDDRLSSRSYFWCDERVACNWIENSRFHSNSYSICVDLFALVCQKKLNFHEIFTNLFW